MKITYYFWDKEGVLAFNIYNKLDQPLYVDWKRSSFVKNNTKMDYWVDEALYGSTTYSAALSGRSAIWSNVGVTIGVAESYGRRVKPERVTFIAPHSGYSRSTFKLYSEKELVLDHRTPVVSKPSVYDPNRTIKTHVAIFRKEHSPLVFRNFLTMSTSEKFDKEIYVDNEFYVSQITEMPYNELLGPVDQETQTHHSKYASADCFYQPVIEMPIDKRK